MNYPNQTKAELIHHTPLSIGVLAVRTCTATEDKWAGVSDELSPEDQDLMVARILTPRDEEMPELTPPHSSVLEHLSYNFRLEFSRTVLQELSRHRVGVSPSVQSTRWALKRLARRFRKGLASLKEMITYTGDKKVDDLSEYVLKILLEEVSKDKPNDVAKYNVMDSFRTKGVYTFNARALCNLFVLRTDKHALWEFRQLAWAIYDALPESHKLIYDRVLHERPDWIGVIS